MKLFYVKREVLAKNIEEALKMKGRVYECTMAAEKDQPDTFTKVQGFRTKKHGKDETK